jgi:hypothetical protein
MDTVDEAQVHLTMVVRKSLHKQLVSRAAEVEMTMRAFVLNALRAQGLDVRDDELADWRKERWLRRPETVAAE